MKDRLSDEQFRKTLELLRKCQDDGIPINYIHRILNAIQSAHGIDEMIERYLHYANSKMIPFTSGTPRKITLFSNSLRFGPVPTVSQEVMQRLVINRIGRVYISYYNIYRELVRKECFSIDSDDAEMLIEEINEYFATAETEMITDAGKWELQITNTEGEIFSFKGPLTDVEYGWFTEISEAIRALTDRDELFAFDGEPRTKTEFVSVEFNGGSKSYYYLTNDPDIRIGDRVRVPVGKYGRVAEAMVTDIEFFARRNYPMPIEDVKTIIGKCDIDILPANDTDDRKHRLLYGMSDCPCNHCARYNSYENSEGETEYCCDIHPDGIPENFIASSRSDKESALLSNSSCKDYILRGSDEGIEDEEKKLIKMSQIKSGN